MSDVIRDYFFQRLGEYVADRSEEELGEGGKDYRSDIDSIIEGWVNYEDNTNSPIERRLWASLLFANDGYERLRAMSEGYPMPPIFGTAMTPQHAVGSFRVDIMLTHFIEGRQTFQIAIECDGHAFHERTKEQAAADRSRERLMIAAGVTVVRFTGSQIHRDAKACADEVTNILSRRIEVEIENHLARKAS